MNDWTEFRTQERVARLKKVLDKRQSDITVIFENIYDPHNIAACLRSCDAIGIYEVHIINYENQIKRNKKLRKSGFASSGSAKKWIKINEYNKLDECINKVKNEGKKIYTTALSTDSISLYELNLTQPVALVFGNEHSGITPAALAYSDGNFLIPQVGMIESLNISVACAVSLYEAFRQKNNAGQYDKLGLSSELYENTLQEWLK